MSVFRTLCCANNLGSPFGKWTYSDPSSSFSDGPHILHAQCCFPAKLIRWDPLCRRETLLDFPCGVCRRWILGGVWGKPAAVLSFYKAPCWLRGQKGWSGQEGSCSRWASVVESPCEFSFWQWTCTFGSTSRVWMLYAVSFLSALESKGLIMQKLF